MSLRTRVQLVRPTPHSLPLIAALALALAACERVPTADAPQGTRPAPSAKTEEVAPGGEVGGPLAGLTPAELAQFNAGRGVFQAEFTPEQGLGPTFNSTGCAVCHGVPTSGGGGKHKEEHAVLQATAFQDGVCKNVPGGAVIQKQVTPALRAALGIKEEPVPTDPGTALAERTTPDLFGFGLLDAVPDAQILALADPTDANGDDISGRAHVSFGGRIGRFNRKAQIPSLDGFNAGAFVFEMGITNAGTSIGEQDVGGTALPPGVDPTPEPELDQAAVDAVNAYVRFLAPPTPAPLSKNGEAGPAVFADIGCADCHVPELTTGDHPVSALSNKVVRAYTDLLLHNMGPELADICAGRAQPDEFRTEPLMGLRFATQFLHDGRAHTIEQAIQWHGGEAAASRARFNALPQSLRGALLEFLASL